MITRRSVLHAGLGLAAFAAFGTSGTLPMRLARAADNLRVRRDVSGLSKDDKTLASYRKAIEAMHAVADDDPRHWARQADIHLDNCPHGNWFFLPWHRAYLIYFEAICAELSGDPTFALPYWDWTTANKVPAAFFGAKEPLDPRRWPDANPSVPGAENPKGNARERVAKAATQMPAAAVGTKTIRRIMGEANFGRFAGRSSTTQQGQEGFGALEGQPHNVVHRTVGGHMNSMLSPLDPIFWLHHCNVDRLWAEWNQTHPNTTEAAWRNFKFQNPFYDGKAKRIDPEQVSKFETLNGLGYTYDTMPAVVAATPPGDGAGSSSGITDAKSIITSTAPIVGSPGWSSGGGSSGGSSASSGSGTGASGGSTAPMLVGETSTEAKAVPFGKATSLDAAMVGPPGGVATSGGAPARTILTLRDVASPAAGENLLVKVFINTPDAGPNTTEDDPGFVAVFSFFGPQDGGPHAHHKHNQVLEFDITDTLAALAAAGRKAEGPVTVQIVPVGIEKGRKLDRNKAGFSIGGVTVGPDTGSN